MAMWDDPEMVKCISCNREFDRNKYESYTCANCESGVVERIDEWVSADYVIQTYRQRV
jgi:predicted RNA-binding Zn-ribbon protein involved in translation (DUF1610 family)